MRCPGAPQAEEGLPDTTSEAAWEGTKAHAWAEWCLQRGEWAEAALDQPVDLDGETWVIEDDGEMARHVDEYLRQVRDLTPEQEMDIGLVEAAVPIGHITGEEGATGTADAVRVVFKDAQCIVRVHDLKYGRGVRVEAQDNPQLVMYASGVIEELDWLLDGFDDSEVMVEMYIHQVRLGHLPEWHLPLPALREWALRISERAALTWEPDAKRIPGEVQCRFCKARTTCPALREYVEQTTAEPPPEDVETIAEYLPRLKLIRDWCATVEARAVDALEKGTEVPGWKLVEGRKTRRWQASEEEIEKALCEAGLQTGDIYKTDLRSPAQVEKALPKKQWQPLQEQLVGFSKGKPTLAPESDKRPAINSAESMGLPDLSNQE